jgi:DNA-binding SARP family transcriptional activator
VTVGNYAGGPEEALRAPTQSLPMWPARSERMIWLMDRQHRRQPCAATSNGPARTSDGCASITIRLLGGFGVAADGIPTPDRAWTRRSAAALVKVLALAPGHCLHREQVMDLLWPDESPARTAPRLHKAAHFARQCAGRQDAVVLQGDLVWLFPDAELTVDAIRFEQLARVALREADPVAAREALTWYRGELLPGDLYEDWASDRREMLRLRRLDLLRVAGEWRELAELEPTDHEAHVELVRRHLAAGAGAAALHEHEYLERAGRSHEPPAGCADRARCARRRSAVVRTAGSRGVTPDDLAAVERSWSELRTRRAALLAALTALTERFEVAPPSPMGPAVRAQWLLGAVEELVELLPAPSRLAARARDLGETWPDPLTAPCFGVEGRAWMGAARECLPTWTDRTEVAWCQAWLLLSDVLAAEALSPFADERPGAGARGGGEA